MSTLFRVPPEDRVGDTQPTPGMTRQQACATERFWTGFVTTEPGMVSGWHHHGGYESSIYVLSGELRMEFGTGGSDSFVAGPGDFVYVGKEVVHREGNPSTEQGTFVVTRGGEGQVVVNVDGPD